MLKIVNLFFGLSLIAVLAFLLLGTISTDITCVRALSGVECVLVRNTPLLKMSKIKILDPQAVDLIGTDRHGMKSASFYRAEIRGAHASHAIPLLSGHNYEAVQSAAHEVNTFLLSQNSSSFFKRFPGILWSILT